MTAYDNIPNTKSDQTTDYFNNFYKPDFDVSQDVDESITAFFEKFTNNKAAAKTMAGSVIATSKAQNLDPMEILQQFVALPKGQINNYLVLFLNTNRIGTSLLGLSNAPQPNKYLTRTILP